jgi:predicted acylesterase/phospholipase RssA
MSAARRVAVSFSGGGHLLAYHLGVAHQLKVANVGVDCFAGSSSGAVAAAVAATVDARGIQEFMEHTVQCRSVSGLAHFLADDAHRTANSNLAISVTDCSTGANRLLRSFTSTPGMLAAVAASCHIPPSFHPLDFVNADPQNRPRVYPSEEGRRCEWSEGGASVEGHFVDGGLSANIPLVPDHHTARVSVLSTPDSRVLAPSDAGGAQGALGQLPVPFSVRLPSTLNMSGLGVYLSLSNLRRVVVAGAGAPPAVLRRLFIEGQRDCASRLETSGGALWA